MATAHTRLKLPFLHGFDRLLIQTHTEALHNLDVASSAFDIHHDLKQYRTAVFRFARFFGVFRIGFIKCLRSTYAAADAKHAAAKTTTFTGTESTAFTGTDAAARDVDHTTATTVPVR